MQIYSVELAAHFDLDGTSSTLAVAMTLRSAKARALKLTTSYMEKDDHTMFHSYDLEELEVGQAECICYDRWRSMHVKRHK